jgi:hypothetical protein|tara:strand:+ start:89 stop:814 length:726 start_codon:yes stop_codon:yes gene_type:complete
MLEISEVIGLAAQGQGGAYQCRGEDNNLYWVKGLNAQRPFQVREWIAAHLAREFGLPIANFCLVNIDNDLEIYLPEEYKNIGYGPCFGSKNAKNSTWFRPLTMCASVPEDLKMDILLFDYWIQNTDRTTHNPNLLWVEHSNQLVVIDHNLSFDTDFNETTFFNEHVFSDNKDPLFTDCVRIGQYKERLEGIITSWDDVIATIPLEWNWTNLEQDHEADIDFLALKAILDRYTDDNFWRMKG